jgi:hypothetical protein
MTSCPYCGNKYTRKDEEGYCKKYHCADRKKRDDDSYLRYIKALIVSKIKWSGG